MAVDGRSISGWRLWFGLLLVWLRGRTNSKPNSNQHARIRASMTPTTTILCGAALRVVLDHAEVAELTALRKRDAAHVRRLHEMVLPPAMLHAALYRILIRTQEHKEFDAINMITNVHDEEGNKVFITLFAEPSFSPDKSYILYGLDGEGPDIPVIDYGNMNHMLKKHPDILPQIESIANATHLFFEDDTPSEGYVLVTVA